MSEITAILTRTNPLGTTLLLVGDDLLSDGELVTSAEVGKDVFEKLLTFAENNQEVRVVISYSDDSHLKLYDYANTVVEDEDGYKGVILEKTGVMLYSGEKPAVDGSVLAFTEDDEEHIYGSTFSVLGLYDTDSSKYRISVFGHPSVNSCFIAGFGYSSSDSKLQFLFGAGMNSYHKRKGRFFRICYLYADSSQGDTYDYSTDGILTPDNAPHTYDNDTSTSRISPFLLIGSGLAVTGATTINVRPFIKIMQGDTVVKRVYGDQLTVTLDSSFNITASSEHHKEDKNTPYSRDIVRVQLGRVAGRGFATWIEELGILYPNYNTTTFPSAKIVYREIDPADLYSDANGYIAIQCAAQTGDGTWHYSNPFIDPNLQTVIANLSAEE